MIINTLLARRVRWTVWLKVWCRQSGNGHAESTTHYTGSMETCYVFFMWEFIATVDIRLNFPSLKLQKSYVD